MANPDAATDPPFDPATEYSMTDTSPLHNVARPMRIECVLWNDPGTGVMRHADAGYEIAVQCAREQGLRMPMVADRPSV